MIYSASSEGKALLFSDNHIYATGTLYSNPYQLLTVNLNVDGTYSDDWANTGAGDGIRILSGSGNNVAMAISRAGSNIYITGLGDGNLVPSPPTAPNSEYISVRYTEAGTVVSPFEDYFPGNESAKVDFGTGITSFCAGQVFVTGCYYDHGSSEDYNFATLVYAQTNTEEDPEGYTITKGSYIGGNLTSLTADDSDYLVIQNGIVLITTDPRVVVEVTGTVDNDPPVSELCFEVDARMPLSASWLYLRAILWRCALKPRAWTKLSQSLYRELLHRPARSPWVTGARRERRTMAVCAVANDG